MQNPSDGYTNYILILTSAIIMPIYGQAKQYTQQIGDPQTFLVQKERTINDVRKSRLVLLEGISNAIGRLKSEQASQYKDRQLT
jgi:hypothetical protein